MWGIFRLIRLRTLAFAVFTLYAMRYFVVQSILAVNDFSLQMNDTSFILLVVAVCCLISGAYLVNDYFGVGAHRISGVKEVLLLNSAAVLIALYLSLSVGIWKIAVLFMLLPGLLWFYFSEYKRYFLIGKIFVALMMALIPLSVLLFEIPALNVEYVDILVNTQTDFMYMFRWVGAFSCFLFANTLLYEINKDLYTQESDMENGIQTLALRCGTTTARGVIALIAGICIVTMWLLYYTVFCGANSVLLYFCGLTFFYLLYIGLILAKKRRPSGELSLIRLLMAGGIAFSLLLNRFFCSLFDI